MTEKEFTIKLKKSDIWKIGTVIFGVLFIISLFLIFNNSRNIVNNKIIAPNNPINNNPQVNKIQLKVRAEDPILGNKDAPISIVEFSDFQCPFCGRVFQGAITDFKNSDYFKTGEVNLIYKNFPLNSIHQYAEKAAEAGECANKQGKFWEYHNKLFENQNALDINNLKSYASQINLDTDKFNNCLDNNEALDDIKNDVSDALSAGARGTPYFVILNKKTGKTQVVSGAVPWTNFESAIQSL